MICSKCGKEIADGVPYCYQCGNQISQNATASVPVPNKRGCGKIIGAAIIAFIMFGAFVNVVLIATDELKKTSSQPADTTSVKPVQAVARPALVEVKRAQISQYAIYKYPETASELMKAGFPKMLKKYGVEGIKKINRLMPAVAQKAATNPLMDRIIRVDVSDNRSTIEELVFYVDSENNNRIYISEQELNSGTPVYR